MKKQIDTVYINFFIVLFLELFFGVIIFNALSIKTIIFYIIESIIISLIIKIATSIFNEKINKITNLLIIIAINIIFISQFIHYRFYNVFYSTYSLTHSAQIFAFFEAISNVIIKNILYVSIFIIPIFIYLILYKKITCKKHTKLNLIYIFFLVISIIIQITIIDADKNSLYSTYDLYHNSHSPSISVKKIGLLNTMSIDLYRYNLSFDDRILSNTSNTNKYDIKNYNITNLNFKNSSNKNIQNLNKYFSNQIPSNKNKYTGIYKNKNLIFITAESFDSFAINKKITPTLYKLANESFNFNNFYSPIYYASTTDGEYTLLNSLLPTEGLWSLQESSNNYFPYSYPIVLKNHKAYAYHNGIYNFYNRNLSHENLGYHFKGCGNGLEKQINCDIWPQSDYEMFNNTFNDYKDDDKFIAYYMTISMHLSYNNKTHAIANKNKKLVENLNYNNKIKAFYATAIELDKGLKKLIDNLEKNNKLDDTVIVLTSDHFPYGLTKNDLNTLDNDLIKDKFSINKNSLIIWNNSNKNKININKYASNLDVLPTLLNLFGINYDSRLLMGRDIFSNEEGLVILNDKSWINEHGKYNILNNSFTANKNKTLNKALIDAINFKIYNKFAVSRLVLKENYYNFLFNKK